jgi:NitT/TauT family transport system substrate-binding protein
VYQRFLAWALTIVCLAAAAGCGSSPAALEKPDITVSVLPTVDSAGFFIALQRGLFAAQGLNVSYVPASSDSALVVSQQLAGQYDVTGESYVTYIEAAAHSHAALDIFAEGSVMQLGSVSLYTMPGSALTSIAGLPRHLIGVDAMFSTDYLLDVAALVDNGVPTADVQFVPVSLNDMGTALASHLIDVATLPEPYASSIEETTGAVPLADLDQGATQGFPTEGYAVTRSWAARHPATLAAFTRAIEQGQEIADTNRAAVQQAIAAYGSFSPVATAMMSAETYPLGVDVTRLQRVADLMLEFELLGAPFQIRSIAG